MTREVPVEEKWPQHGEPAELVFGCSYCKVTVDEVTYRVHIKTTEGMVSRVWCGACDPRS